MYASNATRPISLPMFLNDLTISWRNITDIGRNDTWLCLNILPYRQWGDSGGMGELRLALR